MWIHADPDMKLYKKNGKSATMVITETNRKKISEIFYMHGRLQATGVAAYVLHIQVHILLFYPLPSV
jgi:hypothetical protein